MCFSAPAFLSQSSWVTCYPIYLQCWLAAEGSPALIWCLRVVVRLIPSHAPSPPSALALFLTFIIGWVGNTGIPDFRFVFCSLVWGEAWIWQSIVSDSWSSFSFVWCCWCYHFPYSGLFIGSNYIPVLKACETMFWASLSNRFRNCNILPSNPLQGLGSSQHARPCLGASQPSSYPSM